MSPKNIDEDKLIKYWSESSDEDYETMIIMFRNRRYNWSLFIGHLMIEKLLKALYVKTNNDYPPYIHNLVSLVEKCGLEMTDDQKHFFASVTAFNINARYDDYKKSFYRKCTKEFTSKWVEQLKNYRLWIQKQLQ